MMFQRAQASDPVVDEVVEDITSWIDPVLGFLRRMYEQAVAQLWSLNGGIQIGSVVLTGVLGWLLAKPFRGLLDRFWPGQELAMSATLLRVVKRLAVPIMWVLLLWLATGVVGRLGYAVDILRLVASLLNAWIVIQLIASFVRDRGLAKMFAFLAWTIAALNIVGLLGPTLSLLDSVELGFEIKDEPLTLLRLIKAVGLAVILVWIASAAAGLIRGSLQKSDRLTPSVQTLVAQGARLSLLFAAIMVAMSTIGVDLTALAVFSGAIGVGIGFGLQSIFSNLMAGIILLLEKTIKVGDFVEFDNGLAGEVREINVRATLVTTNDNVDILVPNEEFIRTRVTNWTLREGFRRTRIPFGVAYGTDKDLVKKAALEAAENVPHMLSGPGAREPQVWLTGFGDSSLDFELVVWLKPESVKRPGAVMADYNWAIETALGKYDIEIPFPQRDLHIRSGMPQKL